MPGPPRERGGLVIRTFKEITQRCETSMNNLIYLVGLVVVILVVINVVA